MEKAKRLAVVKVPELKWPDKLEIPSKRFRLFVAANISNVSKDVVSAFSLSALNHGMVYFCSWGPDCERFHDIVDDVVLEDDLGERKFAGPNQDDVIMTTWHTNESLEDALDFFATLAMPTDGFTQDSDFRLVVCVGQQEWADLATKHFRSANYAI